MRQALAFSVHRVVAGPGRRHVAACVVTVLALLTSGCQHEPAGTDGLSATSRASATPLSTAPTPSASATRPRPSPSPTCRPITAVESWPLERLAAMTVAVPVLDFDLAGATGEVEAGAGAVLLLGSRSAPRDLSLRVRSLSMTAPPDSRPLVMADEEGGGVERLAPLVSPFGWSRDLALTMSPKQVEALATRVGRQMRAAGVDVDLAPVADVDSRPGPSASNPDGSRSFSGDAAVAGAYAVAFLTGLRRGGVVPVVKHFPGLGGVSANTDVASASTPPLAQLWTSGLVPFRAAIAAGAPAVMVANAAIPGLTAAEPATLSSAAITGLLRARLGFRGLVLTDSLSAGAVLNPGRSLPAAAVAALAAGADLVLYGSTLTPHQIAELSPGQVRRTFDAITAAIVEAVRTGRLDQSRVTDAALAVAVTAGDELCP